MRKVSPGLVCIVLGVVLLLAAGGLYAYNRCEDAHAGAEVRRQRALDARHRNVRSTLYTYAMRRNVERLRQGCYSKG